MMQRVLVCDGAGHAVVWHPHYPHVSVVEGDICQLAAIGGEPHRVVRCEHLLWKCTNYISI